MTDILRERLHLAAKAAARYRHLTAAEPQRYGPRLGRSLELLADRLAAIHDWDASLDARRAAVQVTRTLARDDARLLPDLAGRLVSLSAACYASGDMGAAISSAREAAELYRRGGNDLALAKTLHQLSRALAVSGDAETALSSMREAVATCRRRAEAENDGEADAPSLAWSLGLLGMRLRLAGEMEAARSATADAVALLERHLGHSGKMLRDPVLAYLRQEYESLIPAPGSSSAPTDRTEAQIKITSDG